MPEFTVAMLKRIQMQQMSPAESEAHAVAVYGGVRPRDIREVPASQYLRMQREYTAATLPSYYRLDEDGARLKVFRCACECQCPYDEPDVCGLQLKCGECDCDERKELGSIPRELYGGHLIDAGNDPIKLTETLLGGEGSCMAMSLSDFRTVQMAIMSRLGTGEFPLSDDGTTLPT